MVKAVVFDTDGMIVKSEMRFSERFSKEFGVPIEKMLPFFKNEFQLCLVGKADIKTELYKYLKDWGWTKSVDDLLKYWFENDIKIDEKMIESIKVLRNKGIKCYLNTNNEKYRVQYLLNEIGLKKFFDGMFYSSQIGYKKPQQEFWDALYRGIGMLEKNEIFVWDDDQENINSAKEFGFSAEFYLKFDLYENWMKLLVD